MKYEVIETVGRDSYPLAQAMWLRVFSESVEFKKNLPWYYESKSFPSGLFLLKESGKEEVIGAISSVFRAYGSNDREIVTGLCADFAVDKSHQTFFPALKLVKSLINASHDKNDLLLGFPNNKSIPVMCRAGFHVLGELPRYALVLQTKHYLEDTPLSIFASLLSAPVNLLIKFYFQLSSFQCLPAYNLTEIFSADESFDQFWQKYSKQNHIYTGKRDSEYMNWRFFDSPTEEFRVFALNSNKTGELTGYAVVEISKEGHWFVFDYLTLLGAQTLKCLFQQLIALAIKDNAVSITLEFLGTKDVRQVLKSLRFSKRPSQRRVVLAPLARSNDQKVELYDVNNWYITSADELG